MAVDFLKKLFCVMGSFVLLVQLQLTNKNNMDGYQ
jgi:hypothetical protein